MYFAFGNFTRKTVERLVFYLSWKSVKFSSKTMVSTARTRMPMDGIHDPTKLKISPPAISIDKKRIAFQVFDPLILRSPDLLIEYKPQPNPITVNTVSAVTITLPLPGRSMIRIPHVFSRFGIG